MTIKHFVESYVGSAVDENGNFRGTYQCFPHSATKGCHQCVSLVKYFCKYIYGTPNATFGDAANGATTNCAFLNGYQILASTTVPKRGDIVVFKRASTNWNYGHIGIVLAADENSLYFLEQNAGSGDGYGTGNNSIRISKTGYSQVLAFRRHNSVTNIVLQDEFDRLVFEGAPYIWEATNNLKRIDVAGHIVKHFGASNFWNGSRPNAAITRRELAIMISQASGKNTSVLYNGSRPHDQATGVEFTIMMHRGKQ